MPGRLIKVKEFECQSQDGPCPEEIQLAISGLKFTNINRTKKEVAGLMAKTRLVSDYSLQYLFPNKIKINILLKKARFAVFNKDTGNYLLFDSKGRFLGETEKTSVPTVVQSGSTPNLFALFIVEGVSKISQVNKGEIVNSSLVIELPSGKRVIFPLEGDKDLLLGSFRLIYSEITNKEIDLRFKNPVLR